MPAMVDRPDCLEQNLTEALAVLPRAYPSLTWMTAQASRLLAEEIERSVKEGEEGRMYAPDQFTFSFFPRDMEPWAAHTSQFRQDLARCVGSALKACGLLAIRDPYITLASDPTLLARRVRTIAWHSRDPSKFIKTLPVSQEGVSREAAVGAVLRGGRATALPDPVRQSDRRPQVGHRSRPRRSACLPPARRNPLAAQSVRPGGPAIDGRHVGQRPADPAPSAHTGGCHHDRRDPAHLW